MKPKQAPLHFCGLRHFNFITCREAKAEADKEAANIVIPQFTNRDDVRPYGDRIESYHRQGNTYWRKREGG